MPLTQVDERAITNVWAVLDHTATPGTPVELTAFGFGDNRFDIWVISSTDTVDHEVWIYIGGNGNANLIGGVKVVASAGFAGVAIADVIASLLPSTQPFFLLPNTTTFWWAVEETISS